MRGWPKDQSATIVVSTDLGRESNRMNNFAISSSGIGEALQRSASALAAAGNTIEESIGLVTGMNAVVQNPESVGTALKTLTMYLRAAKTEAEAAGLETEGMANSVSELRSELQRLTGVDIMLDDNTFKSTYQIIEEIAEAWNGLTDIAQSNVLNLLGGKRNANVLASLITNFEDAEAAMKSAMNSLGSATAENEKYLDSINGKITVLKASFEELSSHIVNSSIVKTLLDIANGVMNVLNLLGRVNLLLPVITAGIMTARGAMNGNKARNAAKGLSAIFQQASGMESQDAASAGNLASGAIITAMDSLSKAQKKLATEQISAAIASSGMSEALKTQAKAALEAASSTATLSGAGKTLSGVLKGVKAAFTSWQVWLLAIELIITGVTHVINAHNQKIQESIDKAHELTDAYSEAQNTYSSNTKTLNSLKSEFDQLSAGVDENGNNVSLTSSQYEKYLSILDQIIRISPQIVAGYDDQGRAILNYKTAVDDAISKQKELMENQRNAYLGSGKQIFDGTKNEYERWQKELGKQGVNLGNAMNGNAQWSVDWGKWEAWRKALRELNVDIPYSKTWKTAYDELMGMYEKSDELLVMLRNSGAYTEDELRNVQTALQGLSGAYTQLKSIEAEQVNYLMEYANSREWIEAIPRSALDELKLGLASVNDPLESYAENVAKAEAYGKQFAEAFSTDGAKNLREMARALPEAADAGDALEEYNDAVAAFKTTLEELGLGSVADMVCAYFLSLSDYAQQGAEATDNYAASVTKLSDVLSSLTKGYNLLTKAKEDMADGGGLSVDTTSSIISLLEDGEKITDYLTYENGLIKLNEEAWKERTDAMMKAKMAGLREQIGELETKTTLPEGVQWYDLEAEQMHTYDANLKLLDQLREELALYEAIYGEIANGSNDPMNLASMISDLEGVGNKAKGLVNALKELESGAAMSAGDVANLALQYEELFGMSPDYDLTTLEGQEAAIESIIDAYKREYDAIIDTQIAELEAAKNRNGGWIGYDERDAIEARITRLESLKELSLGDIYGAEKAEKATKKYEELSKVIDGVTSAANTLAAIQKGDDYMSAFQKVIDFLNENESFDLTEFFNDDGSFAELTPEKIERIFSAILEGAEQLDGWDSGYEKWLRAQFDEIVAGATESKTALEKLSDGMNSIKGAASMLAGMKTGDDYIGTMQDIIDFVQKNKGFSIADFFNEDGYFKTVDDALLNKIFDSLLGNIQALEGYRPEFGTALRQQFGEIISGSTKAKTALEQFSDGIGSLESAGRMLSGMKATDDYIGTMQDVIDFLQENKDFSLDDFFNADASIKDVDEALITKVFDSLLEKISSLEGYRPEFGEALREQFNLIIEGETEVESAISKLKSALSTVTDVSDFFTQSSSGDATILDQLQSALSLAEAFADEQGNAADWTQWIESISTDGSKIKWNEEAIRDMSDAQVEAAFAAAGLTEKYPELIQQIKDSAYAATQAEATSTRVAKAYEKMSSASTSGKEYGGYTQITYDDYQSLIETDKRYAAAIEYQNGVMVLNGAKHDEITSKILEETRAMALHEKQSIQMSDEYQDLRNRMAAGLLTGSEDQQRLLDLEAQIMSYDVLAKEIDGATSAYYHWLNRKGDDGMDRYSQALGAYELIRSTLSDKESEYYGRIGRDEFGTAVDFVIGEHVELNTPEFDRALELANRYLTEGAEGAANFYDDLVSTGLMDSTTGMMDSTVAEIAQTLNVSEEMVRTMIDRINEYQDESGKIKVIEPQADTKEAQTALEQVITSLESAKECINAISETPLAINIQEEEKTKAGLAGIHEMIEGIKTGLTTILQNPLSFNLEDLSAAAEKILEYLTNIKEGFDSVNGHALDIDGNESEATLEALGASAAAVTAALAAVSDVLNAIIGECSEINSHGVNITTGLTTVRLGTVSDKLSSIITQLERIKKNSNITIKINEVTSNSTTSGAFFSRLLGGTGGNTGGSGNALVRGTAMASGGNTLVGELGMETVVDPATNTWYTVGEHGAEFVKLPKDAIVFNHLQTEELFASGRVDGRGSAFASGNAALSIFETAKASLLGTIKKGSTSNTSDTAVGSGTQNPSSVASSKGGKKRSSGSSKDNGKSKLEELKKLYEDLNKQTEHLIAHQEFLYKQAKKGLDYSGMDRSLQAQAELYKKMMADSQAAVAEMIANGAKDTDEELQAMEEAYWRAYDSLYETLDKINVLYVDALNEKIDGIQAAFNNLQAAADEFNAYGGITIDSFQALLENGIQYMSLLENQNGQYVINTEGIQRMIAAQKEQLAVESAVSYLKQLQTALADNEANAVANLVNLTNQLSSTTWDAVYAQAALLRGSLSEDQYARVIENIDALKAISSSVITDLTKISDGSSSYSKKIDDQQDALEKILDLTEDLVKAEAKDRIEAIEGEIDAYKKIIDLKKESLKASKDENDYAKSVAEKTKEIAQMQTRIDQLKLDDSREARAERANLEKQLADLQDELGNLQSDRAYDLQTEALDKAADEFEEARQKEIDAIESSISSAEKLYQAAMARLASGWDSLYQELIDWNTEAGSSLNSEITENWLKAADAVKQYGDYVKAITEIRQAKEGLEGGGSSANTVVAKGAPTIIPPKTDASAGTSSQPLETKEIAHESTPQADSVSLKKVQVMRGNWNVRTGPSTSKKVLGVVGKGTSLEYRGETSGDWFAVVYKGKNAWINNGGSKLVEELPEYHVGGVVGDKVSTNDNEVLSVLEEGEMVLTDKMKRAAYTLIDFKDYLEKKLGNAIGAIPLPLPQAPALAGVGALGHNTVEVGHVNFNPTIQVEINHSGSMSDKDARQYGRTIAATATNELYEGFRKRGIGRIFGVKPT